MLAIFAAASPFLSAASSKSANQSELYAELYSAYKGSYYPGVVSYAEQLETRFPKSILLPEVRVYAGESLFRLGRFDEAEKNFQKAASGLSELNNKEKELKGSALYWLGRVSYGRNNFTQAADSFSRAAGLLRPAMHEVQGSYAGESLFISSLLYGARACLKTEEAAYTAQVVPVLEYLWKTGLSAPVFYEVTSMLFTAYRVCGLNEKLIFAFEQLPRQAVPAELYDTTALYTGEAFSVTGNFSSAYALYKNIIKTGMPFAAVTALERAWGLIPSSAQSEKATLLSDASERLTEYPLLLAEFRTRLGIDEFKQKKYKEAEQNFMLSIQSVTDAAGSASAPELANSVDSSYGGDRFLYTVNVLYLTEIRFRLNGADKKAAVAAYSVLSDTLELAPSQTDSKTDANLAAAVFTQLCRYATLGQNWNAARTHGKDALIFTEAGRTSAASAAALRQPGSLFDPSQTAYWYALAEMQLGNGAAAVQVLETYVVPKNGFSLSLFSAGTAGADSFYSEQSILPSAFLLYANALFQSGKPSQALTIYEALNTAGVLTGSGLLDYAKAALRSGKNALAYDIASRVSDLPEALYIAALASFNRQDWQTANTMFSAYRAESKTQTVLYAFFYHGYVQYRLGDSEKAYNSLTEFSMKNPIHPLRLTSDRIAAVCAMQLHQQNASSDSVWLQKSVQIAESIVKNAVTESDKENAVLFAVDVYDDAKLYDKALGLMKPYIMQISIFGMNCRYRSAQIAVKQKQYEVADRLFAEIEQHFPKEPLAEEAAYRRGESYYTAANYGKAASRFSSYRKTYPRGKYTDAAFYFGAECFARTGQIDQSILQYESLLASYSASTFAYGALSALVPLYREKGEYGAALRSAQLLLSRYGDQAKKAGIERQIAELTLLVSGAQENIAIKQVEFEKAGKLSTAAGRKAGVELAELYLSAPDQTVTVQDSIGMLEKIFSAIKKPSTGKSDNIAEPFAEQETAAKSAYLLASCYRSGGSYTDAARYFLTAAEYYALFDGELAARALYGAAESFDSARQYADARSTADVLFKSFPESVWASRAAAFRN